MAVRDSVENYLRDRRGGSIASYRDPVEELFEEQVPAPGWLDVMVRGQDTRDPVLRTRGEIRRARDNARALQERRRAQDRDRRSG